MISKKINSPMILRKQTVFKRCVRFFQKIPQNSLSLLLEMDALRQTTYGSIRQVIGGDAVALNRGEVFSIGTHIYTGGQTDISVSFGVGSYNFTTDEWNGIWNWHDLTTAEKIGYGFGALANIQDAFSLFSGGGQNINVNSKHIPDEDGDIWGHSSITDENGKTLVSVGPDSPVDVYDAEGNKLSVYQIYKNSIKGADTEWATHFGEKGTWTVRLNNVSTVAIKNYSSRITRWDLLLNSCVGHTTRALWRAGIPTLYAFHPHMLNLQLLIRQIGIYSSPYLYQIP